MKTIKIIIAGGREFSDYDYLCKCMEGIKAIHGRDAMEIVSGGARGADDLGERWAESEGLVLHVMDADWKRLGRRAGLVRNEEMASVAQVLAAFWDGHSRGTRHMIGAAFRNGLETHVFRYGGSGTGDVFGG